MKRFLVKSSTRRLVHWSHFQFRQRLKHKAEELGVRVSECTEQLTSMTCSKCLWVEESFSKNVSKVFECKKCHFNIDRDHNASRNIFLMNGERYVGRMEPVLAATAVTVHVSPSVALGPESRWMWSRNRSNNTATG
jgi:uncharacterized protein YlzI (FlbEa/FlbD family)